MNTDTFPFSEDKEKLKAIATEYIQESLREGPAHIQMLYKHRMRIKWDIVKGGSGFYRIAREQNKLPDFVFITRHHLMFFHEHVTQLCRSYMVIVGHS